MEQIGKYAIVGQIGVGGFGVVYEGRDPFLKRRVAIKTCSSEESEIRDRFFREAEIAGNLQHRNIVIVHDFGVQDGIPYLVQEYLTGEDLDRVVTRRDPLPPVRRVDILTQVACGLEYAHSRGVIHRDIKPGNIRLTTEGVVKIMDFGIAKLSNVTSHLTRTGMTLGTAAYLPPEQIRGTLVDHRADLFSFGVTAYELLTYRRPFAGKTISALFWELLQREPDPLHTDWPDCPPELEELVIRCLAKEPADRYAGFGAVLAEIEPILAELQRRLTDDEPTTSTPVLPPAPLAAPPPATPAAESVTATRPATAPARLPAAPAKPPGPPATPPAFVPPAVAPVPAAPAPVSPAAARLQGTRVTATAPARARVPAARETHGLLGDVQEALAGAQVANAMRRVRELLSRGEVETAERALGDLPADTPAEDAAALRGEVARARGDRLLVQAVARWEQGEPQPALELLEQLLVVAPGHADALRLRQTWRGELEERERQRAAQAAESATRRLAVSTAVARVKEQIFRGDLEAADAALAAALAELGSHQPLRDLRRQISEARQRSGGGGKPSTDAATVGVGGDRLAAARARVEAQPPRPTLPTPPRPVPSWPAPQPRHTPAAPPEPPSLAAPVPTKLIVGLAVVVLVLLLLAAVLWVRALRSSAVPVAPEPTPTSAPLGGVGGTADG
jgi:serine/threonine-protein kinase